MANPVNGNQNFFRVLNLEKVEPALYNGSLVYTLEGVIDASATLFAGQVYSVLLSLGNQPLRIPGNLVVDYSLVSADSALVSAGAATVQVLLATAANSNANAVNLTSALAYTDVNAAQQSVAGPNTYFANGLYLNVAVAGADITAGALRVKVLYHVPLNNKGLVFPQSGF